MTDRLTSISTGALACRIAFASQRGLLLPVASQILGAVGSEANYFSLSERELSVLCGFGSRLFADAVRAQALERGRREAEYVEARQITPLYFTDPAYPQRLLMCDDAPLMIYACGNADFGSAPMLAIVGTRHATAYGIDFVNRLVADLAQACSERLVIVSGLAFGIDVAAHRAAMAAGLPTVGVLAHGLNTIYPAQHRQVAVDMLGHGGALMTEYTSADTIHKGNFLARNRIVAGMCDATIVAESAAKGGAMVTARIAAAYSRDVFALPGRTSDRYSEGCNRLIGRHQAQLVTDASELIEAMGWPRADRQPEQMQLFADLSPDEMRLLEWLDQHPDSQLNDIAVALDIMQGRLNGMLLELEFKDMILRKPGARFCVAR